MLRSRLRLGALCVGVFAALLSSCSAPCSADPLAYRIKDPGDDGTEIYGVWYPQGVEPGVDCLGRDSGGRAFIAAFRFEVPDLVQGQEVAFARLRIGCTEDLLAEPLRLVCKGAGEDSPERCSPTRLPSTVTRTATSTIWELAPSSRTSTRFFYRTSPNLAPIISEILARPNWGTADKAILLVIEPDTAGARRSSHLKIQDCTGRDRRRAPAILEIFPTEDDAFAGKVMLGRPTDTSITLNAMSLLPLDLFVEYGRGRGREGVGAPAGSAEAHIGPAGSAEMILSGLDGDSEYWYQVRCRSDSEGGENDRRAGPAGRFHTRRARGSPFVFTIQADSHMGTVVLGTSGRRAAMYARTLENVAADNPDFHIDLGDFSRLEVVGRRSAATLAEAFDRYASQRYFLADLCQDVPFFLVIGNHEGEQGWRRTLPDDSLSVWGTAARRQTIPNPYPDGFYSGNPDTGAGGPIADYYAWQWGDALFVVIDPFRYTVRRPHRVGGRGKTSLDGWDWTLGREQYEWLYQTLHQSGAKWKFVFAHHMTGGTVVGGRAMGPYGRGGIDAAQYRVAHRPTFEWGGEDSTGAYVFDVKRPGWSHGPIHRMMVDEGVDVFFRGHDHVFVYETLDGVVYQTCPVPTDRKYSKGYFEPEIFTTGTVVNNMGHLRVAVSSDSVRVDYVRSVMPEDEPLIENGIEVRNGDTSYTYTLRK